MSFSSGAASNVAIHPEVSLEDVKLVKRWQMWPLRAAVITCSCLIVSVLAVTGMVLLPSPALTLWAVLVVAWLLWLLFMDYHVFEPRKLVKNLDARLRLVQLYGGLWRFYVDQYTRIQSDVPKVYRDELQRALFMAMVRASRAQAVMEQNCATGDTPTTAAYFEAEAQYSATCQELVTRIDACVDTSQD